MRKLLVVVLLAFAGSLLVAVPSAEAKPVPVHKKAHQKPVKKQKKKKHHHVYHHRHHRHAPAAVA